jgi:hypothetical protein
VFRLCRIDVRKRPGLSQGRFKKQLKKRSIHVVCEQFLLFFKPRLAKDGRFLAEPEQLQTEIGALTWIQLTQK